MSGPRTSRQLISAAVDLYRRFPLLFLSLAAAVILPYEVIVLVTTGAGPFEHGSLSFGVSSLLTLVAAAAVSPFVSALHVHAVREVGEGRQPRLGQIALQGVRVLPVVAATTIIATLGMGVGFALLVVPGVILWLRWYVAAQTAAIEHEGWIPALRRSGELTAGNYRHIFAFAIWVGLFTFAPTLLVGLAFGEGPTTVASFLVGVLLQIVTWSFSALAAGLLYFDLRARFAPADTAESPANPSQGGGAGPAVSTSWHPDSYEDHDRPQGWYVDPSSPERMRYWGLGDPPGWGATMRTPRKIRRAWRAAQRDEDR